MMFIVIASVILFALYLIKKCLKSFMFISQFDKTPGPRPRLPIVVLSEKTAETKNDYRNNGYMTIVYLDRIYLLVFKHSLVAELLPKIHNRMDEFKIAKQAVGNCIVMNDFDEWKPKRRLFNKFFKPSILNEQIPVINETVDIFIDKMSKYSKNQYFDITPLVYEWSLATILATVFGISPQTIYDSCRAYVENYDMMQTLLITKMFFPYNWMRFLYDKSKAGQSLQRAIHELNQFGRNLVMKKKQEMRTSVRSSDGQSFLEWLLELQENGANITDEDIRAEVDVFVIGGYETSACALVWLILMVSNNPEIQERLRTELQVVFGDEKQRLVTKEDLSQLVYTECVIKETLRLFPPVHSLPRAAEEEFFLDGHKFPKNTSVTFLLFMANKDEEIFDKADEFIPERFLERNKSTSIHSFAGGAGSRDCIGRQLAMNAMKLFVAKLFRNFELKAKHRRTEVKPNYVGLLHPDSAVLIHSTEIN